MTRPNINQIELESYTCGLPRHVSDMKDLSKYIMELERKIKSLELSQCLCNKLPE